MRPGGSILEETVNRAKQSAKTTVVRIRRRLPSSPCLFRFEKSDREGKASSSESFCAKILVKGECFLSSAISALDFLTPHASLCIGPSMLRLILF